jgi:hypothetical protein
MATDAELLTSAKDAQHKLLTGRSVRVFVDQNGERVEYNAANRGALAAYIADLERRLSTQTPRGPMRVFM